MKKILTTTIVSLLLLAGCNGGGVLGSDATTKEGAQKIAENWIEENAPTYVYDGSNLERTKIYDLQSDDCPQCWRFEFTFQSSSAGYGDRSDQATAQVITDHTIQIVLEDGEVVGAVTDDAFDEFSNTPIEQ